MNRFNRQVGDWVKLRSGHIVVDRDDPRHEGRVEAILSLARAQVLSMGEVG